MIIPTCSNVQCIGQAPVVQRVDLTLSSGKISIHWIQSTVKPLYYEHQGDRNKCPYLEVSVLHVQCREVGFIWILVSQGPSELSVQYRGVRIIEVSVRRGSTVLQLIIYIIHFIWWIVTCLLDKVIYS